VQLGEHDLHTRQAGARLDVHGDAPPLVGDGDAPVALEGDRDLLAVATERLVHGVVDDLPQAVHEPPGVGRPDVHRRTLADGFQALQDQQMPCLVLAALGGRTSGGHAVRVPPLLPWTAHVG
jgi:hypothetical protein